MNILIEHAPELVAALGYILASVLNRLQPGVPRSIIAVLVDFLACSCRVRACAASGVPWRRR